MASVTGEVDRNPVLRVSTMPRRGSIS